MSVELRFVELSNFRGFQQTTLDLNRDLTILVGPNNSGKTSVLRILDWFFNSAREPVLLGDQPLTDSEARLLLPARETRNAARRLTFGVYVVDGRRHARFGCDPHGIARLRIGLTVPQGVPRMRLNLGAPHRGEESDRDSALPLLTELRARVSFQLIPAARDAASETFRSTFQEALMARLQERALHAKASGAPAEYRAVKGALDELNDIARRLASPLWDAMKLGIPPGLAEDASLGPEIEPRDLVSWIARNIVLRLRTGSHDEKTVDPVDVGSGLQSLLELAIHQTADSPKGVEPIVAVEEPEAFLHPSAQRTLARIVFRKGPAKRLVSTHSTVLVDEAPYGSVVLVRDHRFYHPREVTDADRDAINSALMAGHGSEMAFARSVLLVEGESDRLFFEHLRRRLAANHNDGRLDQLFVVPVGSNTRFGPWIRLLQSYGDEGSRPISWIAAADGDAPTELARGYREAGMSVPLPLSNQLQALAQANTTGTAAQREAVATTVNRTSESVGARLHLLPVDLEWVALESASNTTVTRLVDLLDLGVSGRTALLDKLGSKYATPSAEPLKAPYLRAVIARELPWSEVSDMAKQLLRRWLGGAMSESAAAELLADNDT